MRISEGISRFKQSFTAKLFMVGFLALLFLIPLSMVEGVIRERVHYREDAVRSIEASWAEAQTLFGPVLVVPYKEYYQTEHFDSKTQKTVIKKSYRKHVHYVLPQKLQASASIETEERYRGIYTVPVYTAKLDIQGTFVEIYDFLEEKDNKDIRLEDPYIAIGIQDVRGIGSTLNFRWNEKTADIEAGTRLKHISQDVHIPLTDIGPEKKESGSFSLRAYIKGIKSFHLIPVGESTSLTMKSAWPDPSFNGRFLPSQRTVSDKGFEATWETGLLATNMEKHFNDCASRNQCGVFRSSSFGVDFFQPVDIYQQVQRTVKYGVLFIALTFAVFFIFEALKSMRIHPVQYVLVGSALAVFYLLLVSLSEHISFGFAYLLAAFVTAGLLGYYVRYVLKSLRGGAYFGALVAMLYAVLYAILRSQDYALLMGASLLFAVLVTIMYTTRNINWYEIGKTEKEETQ